MEVAKSIKTVVVEMLKTIEKWGFNKSKKMKILSTVDKCPRFVHRKMIFIIKTILIILIILMLLSPQKTWNINNIIISKILIIHRQLLSAVRVKNIKIAVVKINNINDSSDF